MTRRWLRSGAMALEFAPDLGGAVTRFSADGRDIFRPTLSTAADAAQSAAFALVPFPNRIAQARFAFEGRTYRIATDRAGNPHALHGAGWRSCWTIDDICETGVRLSLGDMADWPWRCRASQSLSLRDDGMDIAITLENIDAADMPAGIGWHPAFACRASDELRLQAGGYLPTIAHLPTDPAPLPAHWTLQNGVPVGRITPIDHCLLDWDGALEIRRDDLAIRVATEDCAFLQAYAPAGADFICLEPQTCTPDAFNRDAASGARRLRPGEALTIRVRIDLSG